MKSPKVTWRILTVTNLSVPNYHFHTKRRRLVYKICEPFFVSFLMPLERPRRFHIRSRFLIFVRTKNATNFQLKLFFDLDKWFLRFVCEPRQARNLTLEKQETSDGFEKHEIVKLTIVNLQKIRPELIGRLALLQMKRIIPKFVR